MPQRILACLLLLLLTGAFPEGILAEDALSEADLKAAFLYNFTKFVEWPADSFAKEDSPFVVGIFGDEEFVSTVRKKFEDKKAHGHAVQVRRLTQNSEARSCNALYFREAETKRLAAVYESIKKSPLLTVGESKEFLEAGGMFNLFIEEKQLRFEVNPGAADDARLAVSSKLLRLAKSVRKGGVK